MRRTIPRRAILGPVAVFAMLGATVFGGRAAADETDGFYFGANFGYTLSTYGRSALDDAFVGALNGAGDELSLDASSVHAKQAVWSADVGYMISPYFSIEGSYLDLGKLRYSASGTATSSFYGSMPLSTDLSISSRGPALALAGVLPMTDHWYVNARAGAYEGRTTTDATTVFGGSANPASESGSSTALLAGAGTSYVLGRHFVLRLDYTYLNGIKEKLLGKSFDVSLVSAGIEYAF